MPPKKVPAKKRKKVDIAIETAKDIHKRKSQPRNLVAWLKGIRKKQKFIFAVGIILTGIYLVLSKDRRGAFKRMFKGVDRLATSMTQTAAGGAGLVASGADYVRSIGRMVSNRESGVGEATRDISHLASSKSGGDTFIKSMLNATEEASEARGMSVYDIIEKYKEFAPTKPKLVGRPGLPMSHESENSLLKQWIPALRNHVYTINKLKAAGYHTEKHTATSERLAQQFSDAMNKTRKMHSV